MASPESLRTSDLFAQFDDATLARLAERFQEVELPANQVLIEPRTAGAGLFLICDGTVEVEAHELRRELGPGDDVEHLAAAEPRFGEAIRELARRRLEELRAS